jgi:hypothetical protein
VRAARARIERRAQGRRLLATQPARPLSASGGVMAANSRASAQEIVNLHTIYTVRADR